MSINASLLRVEYPTPAGPFHALGPISFSLQKGEFVSILGPSGCGKSTLAKVLTGIITDYTGTFTIDKDVEIVSTVFQDYGVFPWKTAVENVEFALRERGHSKRDAKDSAMLWLANLRIEKFAASYPYQLSGGMKQRLSIARALAIEPQLLILDEPFAAIDTQLREVLQEELLDLQQKSHMTTLQFTHNYDEALLLSDRILLMSPSPATIHQEIAVPFERPRSGNLREETEFTKLRLELRQLLRAEVQK